MTLKFDPEYATASAPIMAMMANVPSLPVHDVEGRRNSMKALGDMMAALPQYPDVEVKEHKIKSYDGAEIVVYHLRKQGIPPTPGPAIVHAHGGGMIAGSALHFQPTLTPFVSLSGVQFFDVEYRLAPEHPHPTLTEDVYACLTWLHENADQFQVDRTRIGVMGESAGGGIAAGVALMARDRNLQPPLAKQILIYPMLDSRNVKPTILDELAIMWKVDSNITGWAALLGDKLGSPDVSPYASPSHVKSIEGLPSTFIDVGTLDLFRDEDVLYAQRLAAANIDVEFHLYPGVPHGFELLGSEITITQQAKQNRLRAIKSF